MADEDTPKNRESSFLGQVSNSVLYWDTDIQPQLSVYKISDVQDAHVLYSATEIEAIITPDGKFVSLKQALHANISVGSAKFTILLIRDISAKLDDFVVFSDFRY